MTSPISRSIKTLGLAALLGVAALSAQAAPHGRFGAGPEGGWHGGPMMMLGGHALKDAGVTDAQRAQIKQIFEAARNDLKSQRDTQRQLRERAEALFVAPTVDANAVEQLRQQMAAQQDIASKRMSLAMIEASRVLSPEQRTKIAESMKQHRARMEERMKARRDGERPGPRGDRGPAPVAPGASR